MRPRIELISARKKLELTQEQVAKHAGISRAYYTNIEAGRKEPSMSVAKSIADYLGTSIDKIFFEDCVPKANMV